MPFYIWCLRVKNCGGAEDDNAAAVSEGAERERCGRAGPVARERIGQTAKAGALHWRRHREERRRRVADHLRPTQAARLARGAERRERAGACILSGRERVVRCWCGCRVYMYCILYDSHRTWCGHSASTRACRW